MKTKLQKLVDTRRRLDKRQSEVDALRREALRTTMETIFEFLGVKASVELNDTSHSTSGIFVNYSDGFTGKNSGFEVKFKTNGVEVITTVKSESDEKLITFKKLMEVK